MSLESSKSVQGTPVVSIVIPVYGTEMYLRRCLDSIIKQTYRHLEIIVVNDCSPGNAYSIIEEYRSKDPRIKYLEHAQNKGLYHARLTGSEAASGDFIAFVDSDDYVSIDYYRLLVQKAVHEKADIVEGRIIREHEDGHRFIQNNNNILFKELEGDKIKEQFFSQEGLFYHWHVIWNKIYRKELWDKCFPFYQKQNEHLIMTEDFVFSSILFCNAEKYCSIEYDGYFYTIRPEAATGSDSDLKKFLKNFNDMGTAFDFVESYLEMSGLSKEYKNNVLNWKRSYFRLWANRIKNTMSLPARNQALQELQRALRIDKIEAVLPEDHYHGIISTPWEHRYEEVKRKIADDQYDIISFDIFDTLIVRPFLDPRDLLLLLDDYYHEIVPNSNLVEFSEIRLEAENKKRQLVKLENPSWQDVNLNEVYQFIEDEYEFSSGVISQLKEKEIELEIRFTQARESVKELYKMARELGKKIIFISDMYLPETVITKLLEKAGYTEYERLYVSSETRLLKNTGDMYKFVLNELEISPERILHMGDNWDSDVIRANNEGIESCFIPKTSDLLLNNLSDKETGNSVSYFGEQIQHKWTSLEFPHYLSTRCMLAVVANKIFDNPYPTFNADSDFNIDPYVVGYYALGMHTFGLTHWLLNDSSQKGYKRIHFMARDGYLPFKVFNIISRQLTKAPKSNYIYASRRSLLPLMLESHNKYGLDSFVSIAAHTPSSILELFKDVLIEELDKSKLEEQGIVLSKTFSTKYEFKKFIDILVGQCIDQERVAQYKDNLKKYFSKIQHNDATFDLGYSARLQTMIVDIIGHQCDTYFVHTSGERPWTYSRRNEFKVHSFYEYKPVISGILREQFFAELGPSCIGYEKNESGQVDPLFEPHNNTNQMNDLMITKLHEGCLNFAEDMVETFGDYIFTMKLRNEEVSTPLEMYIHNSKPGDRSIFLHSYSDDFVHGGNEKNSILTWWNHRIEMMRNENYPSTGNAQQEVASTNVLYNHGRFSKAVFYAFFDRETLKKKVKERYSTQPFKLKALSIPYRTLRKIKRVFIK